MTTLPFGDFSHPSEVRSRSWANDTWTQKERKRNRKKK